MAVVERVLEQQREPAAVRLVLQPLPPLILHDVPLLVELLVVGGVEQRGQPVGLDPQQVLEVARRHGREVVRAVVARGAVDAAFGQVRAGFLGVHEVLAAGILRALEHHVLEQVRKARAPPLLVLRSDVEPLVHVHDRQLAVDVQDHLQAVGERVLLELEFRQCCLTGSGALTRQAGPERHQGKHDDKQSAQGAHSCLDSRK